MSRTSFWWPIDEDDVAAGVGVGAELAARARADDDLTGVGDGVRAAEDVVRRGAQLSPLAVLRFAVERVQAGPHRIVATGLFDLLGDAEFAHRLREGDVYLRALRDRSQHQLSRLRRAVGDVCLEAAAGECSGSPLELAAVGGSLEIEVRWTGVRESDGHARGSLRSRRTGRIA